MEDFHKDDHVVIVALSPKDMPKIKLASGVVEAINRPEPLPHKRRATQLPAVIIAHVRLLTVTEAGTRLGLAPDQVVQVRPTQLRHVRLRPKSS